MNRIRDADFMEQFPPALKKDISMKTLGGLIAEELHITAEEIQKNIIYADMEKLSEKWLDVLAYDLHADWYDYDYPVDIKRAVIRNSIRIHQKLGTKYAVETAMRDVHKGADVSEWFEYGGKPYHFKIDVDISREGLSENTGSEITDKVNFYKNLRSHCDGIYYHLKMDPANVSAAACLCTGATLKVKAALTDSMSTETRTRLLSAAKIGENIRVKAALAEHIKGAAAENAKALAAAVMTGEIRIKAYLTESIQGQAAGAAVYAGTMRVDRLKVKAPAEKELKAGFGIKELGYLRIKNEMTVRKEQ